MVDTMSKEDRQEAIDKFKKQNPGRKINPLEGGTGIAHGEAKTKPEQANGEQQQPEPERTIETKTFTVIPFKQGKIEGCILAMTMLDVADYMCFAEDLYDVEKDKKGKAKLKDMNPENTWQRGISASRPKDIAQYLMNDIHFIPSLICIPVNDGVSIDGNKLTLPENGLAALDGQHRKAGIEYLISQAQVGPDSDFAKEEVSVIVITSDLDIDDRQQIFSDINRSAKVVSKALNILYDHRDPYAVLAHRIAKDLGDVVDLTHTAPTAKSSNVCSLSNIYNLVINFATEVKKNHARAPLRKNLTEDIVHDSVLAMIRAFPSFERLSAGHDTYGAVRASFPICFSSTGYQGMGSAAKHATYGVDASKVAETLGALVASTKWEQANPAWEPLMSDGKVKVRSEDINKAGSILEAMWAEQKATITE